MIKAVLFDWDTTLAMIGGNVSTSQKLARLLQDQDFSYSPADIGDALQIRQERIQAGKLRGKLEPQTRQDILHYYMQFLSILKCTRSDRAFAYRLYGEFGRLPVLLYEGTLSVLQKLAEMGVTLGIISNTSKSARETIEVNFRGYIPPGHIIISEEIGVHKPARTIFRLAAARVNIPAEDCLFVGDNLHVDAIGAVQQGGYALGLWIDRKGKGADLALPKGVYRISLLAEILHFVS